MLIIIIVTPYFLVQYSLCGFWMDVYLWYVRKTFRHILVIQYGMCTVIREKMKLWAILNTSDGFLQLCDDHKKGIFREYTGILTQKQIDRWRYTFFLIRWRDISTSNFIVKFMKSLIKRQTTSVTHYLIFNSRFISKYPITQIFLKNLQL